jgi:hypothetical protein
MSKAEIISAEMTFTQDNHSESNDTLGEYLLVKRHGLIDENYWTINTQQGEWSFDSPEELLETIQRAITAMGGS